MKSWDAIIIGGGIIGLSLAISLRKRGLRVLIVERGEPGREASYAAAGMLAGSGLEIPTPLRVLAERSAAIYPEFVHELKDESGVDPDLRDQGAILLSQDGMFPKKAERLSCDQLRDLEPGIQLAYRQEARTSQSEAAFLNERSVDPRSLVQASIRAAKHRAVDISSGSEVTRLLTEHGHATGVETTKTPYAAPVVVNCTGAWAGAIAPQSFPVKPIKGQMLAVVNAPGIQHVLRSEKVYLVPRSDGRLVIGSTLEDCGYNKRTDVDTIQRLFDAATEIVPALARAKRVEAWAGLRPGTPDELPMLGETETSGYFVATGHYRDGILLAPITAEVMTRLVFHEPVAENLAPFSPLRFG